MLPICRFFILFSCCFHTFILVFSIFEILVSDLPKFCVDVTLKEDDPEVEDEGSAAETSDKSPEQKESIKTLYGQVSHAVCNSYNIVIHLVS